MKTRKLLFIASTCLLTLSGSAQITLTQNSYSSFNVIGNDSVVNTINHSAFPSLVSDANANWDMSTITDTDYSYFIYRLHPDSSAYQFADSVKIPFGGTFISTVHVDYSILNSGILGFAVFYPSGNTPLGTYTSNNADTMWTPKQTDIYSSPDTVIKFPCTYHSTWSSAYLQEEFHILSIAAFKWTKAPFVIKHHYSFHDTVKGWGEMRVKNLISKPSSYFDVLQVQITESRMDSFFVNGSPAPTVALTTFGLTQGEVVTNYYQNYYRAEEVTPFATVNYNNPAFTNPESATTMVENLYNTAGIANITNEVNMMVYPNPGNGVFTFAITNYIPKLVGRIVEVYNVLGEKVIQFNIQHSSLI
jgi:hypothetical protein